MSTSKLDAVYRSILLTKFFTKGWGKPENLRRLFEFRKVVSNRDECLKLIERDYPVTITKEEKMSDCRLLEGYFMSPLEKFLPGIVPEIAQKAYFQAVLPLNWPDPKCKPVCLHLAGTGDHFFWRRRNLMVKPLMKEAGIGGIILENPFYGLRKPTDQVRSSLHNVSDIFVMGGCLILEALVLFHWCERNGLGPLGVTGLSMGGHMASLAATNWPKPLVLVPCLSWSTASAVFLQGVMSNSINWDLLEDQYLSDGVYREKLSKMVTIVDEAFLAGKKFAQVFSFSENKPINTPTDSSANVDKDASGSNLATGSNTNPGVVDNKLDVDTKPAQNSNKENLESIQSILSKDLTAELKKLLDEGKIDLELFTKLSANESFELNAKDIQDINKLIDGDIKELLLKYKIAELKLPDEEKQQSTTDNVLPYEVVDTSAQLSPIQNGAIINPKPSSATGNAEAVIENKQTVEAKVNPEIENKKPESRYWNVSNLTSDLWTNIPFLKGKTEKKIDITKIHWRDREALQFMRGVMDECTHLSNFSVPFDTSLIIAVCAKHDAYVPRDDVGTLEEIWPGAEVRYVDAGHVSAYVLHQSMFRACIIEAFERSKKKWKDGKHVD